MSKITNDGLTWHRILCSCIQSIWQHWASKG